MRPLQLSPLPVLLLVVATAAASSCLIVDVDDDGYDDGFGGYDYSTVTGYGGAPDTSSSGTGGGEASAEQLAAAGQIYDIAVDLTNVYWLDASAGAIHSVPVNGGAISDLAFDPEHAIDLEINGTHAYWTSYGTASVKRVPLAGGAVEDITVVNESPLQIALDGANVYVGAQTPTEGYCVGELSSAPLAGGPATILYADITFCPVHLAVDASWVYMTHIHLTNDGTATIARVPIAGGAPETLASGLFDPEYLVADSTNLYWVDLNGGLVQTMSKDGGPVTTLGTATEIPSDLAIDPAHLYWTSGSFSSSTLFELPIAGGEPVQVALADDGPGPLTLDGGFAYWGSAFINKAPR